jgi:hypothetical protein
MKNILKLSVLIAGLSLCMMENAAQELPESQVTIVRNMNGDQVISIVGGTVDKLMAQLSCPKLGQVVDTPSLVCEDQILSPDDIISAGSEVQMVITNSEYKQVTLPAWGGEKTCTFYGKLNIDELNIGSLSFKTLQEYIDYIQHKEGDISVENLFLNTEDIHIDADARFDMLNGINNADQI